MIKYVCPDHPEAGIVGMTGIDTIYYCGWHRKIGDRWESCPRKLYSKTPKGTLTILEGVLWGAIADTDDPSWPIN